MKIEYPAAGATGEQHGDGSDQLTPIFNSKNRLSALVAALYSPSSCCMCQKSCPFYKVIHYYEFCDVHYNYSGTTGKVK